MLPRSQYLQHAITITNKINRATGTRILTCKDTESPSDDVAAGLTLVAGTLGVEELAVGLDGETLINAVDVSAVDINFDGRSEV